MSNSARIWTHIVTSPYVPSLLRWKQPSCSIIVLPGVHLVMHLTPLSPFQHDIPPQGGTLCRERDAVPASTPNWCALFICLYLFKCVSCSQFCSKLTPAAPRGERDGIFSSVLKTMCPFPLLMSVPHHHHHHPIKGPDLTALKGSSLLSVNYMKKIRLYWKNSVYFCFCAFLDIFKGSPPDSSCLFLMLLLKVPG